MSTKCEDWLTSPVFEILRNLDKKGPYLTYGPRCLLAPRAGLGHYGRNSRFSLRHLPFGFLTRHIRGAFPPTSVGGILASSPAMGKSANKKGPYYPYGPLVCWLPGQDSNLQPSG